jgi:putative ABC transport system ATP-binding protein
MMGMNNIAVELRNVCKTYKMGEVDVKALCNIDMKIKKGEFVSIIGPSGSGKSTMLNMIGALDRPSQGSVFIDGVNVSHMNDSQLAVLRGKKIGFIFQTFNLIPRFTATENVMLPMWFAGMDGSSKERAIELLTKVGLGQRLDHVPAQLSGGERQRVAIARALANDPEIIVADEPTGNLDSKKGKEIVEMLHGIHGGGATVIVVTHDLDVAKIAEREIHIKDGMIFSDKKNKR